MPAWDGNPRAFRDIRSAGRPRACNRVVYAVKRVARYAISILYAVQIHLLHGMHLKTYRTNLYIINLRALSYCLFLHSYSYFLDSRENR